MYCAVAKTVSTMAGSAVAHFGPEMRFSFKNVAKSENDRFPGLPDKIFCLAPNFKPALFTKSGQSWKKNKQVSLKLLSVLQLYSQIGSR